MFMIYDKISSEAYRFTVRQAGVNHPHGDQTKKVAVLTSHMETT